jgi:PKD repeat protein
MDEFSITYEPVRAGFMAEPLVGSSPLTVVFTNVTTGSRNQQIWNFGDGITDTLVNPVHEYTVPGVYTVTLNASGPGGDDVITRTSYLSVYAPVRADFVAEPTSGVAPLAVSFTNNTSGDYVTSVWSFGDGVTSTLPSPTHTYAAPGVYTVMLNASGLGGNDVITRTNQIRVLWQSFMPVILKQTGP